MALSSILDFKNLNLQQPVGIGVLLSVSYCITLCGDGSNRCLDKHLCNSLFSETTWRHGNLSIFKMVAWTILDLL